MTNRWSTLRIDEASVMHLGVIDTPTLGRRRCPSFSSSKPSGAIPTLGYATVENC